MEHLNVENSQALQTRPVQGRFIVHPRHVRDLQVHEVFVDLENAHCDESGNITKRGNFEDVMHKLQYYKDLGINCIYLMGALERDNGLYVDQNTQITRFSRVTHSPLSITNREVPNRMLGGEKLFQ
jgi:starch synthase